MPVVAYPAQPVFGLPNPQAPVLKPLQVIDAVPLASGGENFKRFTEAAARGWQFGGNANLAGIVPSSDPNDPDCIDLSIPTRYDRIWRPLSDLGLSDNFELVLTCHGVEGYGRMPSLCLLNNVGTGTGCGPYSSSGGFYLWGITTYGYSASAGVMDTTIDPPKLGSGWAMGLQFVLRLRKVGTTLSSWMSYDGGVNWTAEKNRTDAATHDRISIGSIWTAGATSAKLRIGRLNIVRL